MDMETQAELTNPEIRKLKARAQLLEPTFKLGKAGLSDAFVQSIDQAFAHHDLIKVKFVEFKEDKKTLAPLLAEKTSSRLIMRVGNVAVLYRRPARTGETPVSAPTAGSPQSS